MIGKKKLLLLGMLGPAFFLYCILVLIPIIMGLSFSFFEWNGAAWTPYNQFIGLGNYIELFSDERFQRALFNTLIIVGGALVFQLFVGFFLAWLSYHSDKLRKFFQSVVYFPSILSLVVVGILWSWVFDPRFGIINNVLTALNLDALAINWLGNPATALLAIMVAQSWQGVGFYVIIFIVALRKIPKSFYYSAKVDGLSAVQTATRVIIPMVKETFLVGFIICVATAFRSFDLVLIMTQGGPARLTEVLSFLIWRVGFVQLRFGYASTIGAIMLFLTIAIAIVYMKITKVK